MKFSVSTAESCTSGRIAALLTSESGASEWYRGGIVAYQTEMKVSLLKVPQEMIDKFGVVSRTVAEEMVRRACDLFNSDYALASTGYTEPYEGHEIEMWVAWGSKDDVHSVMVFMPDGDREDNARAAAEACYVKFLRYIGEKGENI